MRLSVVGGLLPQRFRPSARPIVKNRSVWFVTPSTLAACGPPATMLETDAGVDTIGWLDADRFEIRIDLTYQVGGTQRLRGTLGPLRVVVDTLRPLPAR